VLKLVHRDIPYRCVSTYTNNVKSCSLVRRVIRNSSRQRTMSVSTTTCDSSQTPQLRCISFSTQQHNLPSMCLTTRPCTSLETTTTVAASSPSPASGSGRATVHTSAATAAAAFESGMGGASNLTLTAPDGSQFVKRFAATDKDLSQVLPVSRELAFTRSREHSLEGIVACCYEEKTTDRESPRSDTQDESAVAESRTPLHSWRAMRLPLGSNHSFRTAYRLFESDYVRMGLVLEHLDALASDIAYRHAGGYGKAPMSIVTACVDRFDLRLPITNNRDLWLEGKVGWVGRSSMEIRIGVHSVATTAPKSLTLSPTPYNCSQRSGGSAGCGYDRVFRDAVNGAELPEYAFHGDVLFMMVARDPKQNRATQVPALTPLFPEDEVCYIQGEQEQHRRKEERSMSLDSVPPSVDEQAFIHELFMLQAKNELVAREQYMAMANTKLAKTEIMHSQDRNIHNKVFGGNLMRLGLESAYIAARAFSIEEPVLQSVDEVTFFRPVNVGSVVSFESQVAFADPSRHIFAVSVNTNVLDTNKGGFTKDHSNTFWFVFYAKGELRKVMPHSYAEAMLLLSGRRHIDRLYQ
jgi:acyl-coenzyme A thioesterase 9